MIFGSDGVSPHLLSRVVNKLMKYDAPKSRSHVLDSSVVSRTSDSIGFSMDSMFGSVVKISAEESM